METPIKSGRMHYAWKILIVCCCINASALGLTNTNGVLFTSICEDLGILMSSLTVHTVVHGLCSAFTLIFVDRVYKKYPIKPVLIINLLLYHLSFMSMAFFNKVWQFCLASVITGASGAFLLYMAVPLLLNNWFVKKKKLALSICFVASGLSGILTNLVLGVVISKLGWRNGYLIRGLMLLLFVIPVALFVKKSPAEMGLKPYGQDDDTIKHKEQKIMGESGARLSFEERRVKYICCIFLAVTFNLGCAMVTQLPHYAGSLGMDIMTGSLLTSLAMVGNIGSKALSGPAVERAGITKTGIVITGMISAAFAAIAFGFESRTAISVVALISGFTACTNTLIIPNLLDTFVKGDDYVHMLSRCSMGTMIASSFSALIASALYDISGNYRPVFLIYGLMEAVNIAVLLIVFRKKRLA